MLGLIAQRIARRLLMPKQRPPNEGVWHLWTALYPKRSITGRLLWGAVLRRQNNGRWIYKRYIEAVHGVEFAAAAQMPAGEPGPIADRAPVLPEPMPSLTRGQKTAVVA